LWQILANWQKLIIKKSKKKEKNWWFWKTKFTTTRYPKGRDFVFCIGFWGENVGLRPLYMRVQGLGSNEIERSYWVRGHKLNSQGPLDEGSRPKVANQG
jgi:hypothetical protein